MTAECPSCLSHFHPMSANLLVFILRNRVLLPSQASLKLTIFLPQAVRCRDSGCTPLLLHSSGVPTAPPPLLPCAHRSSSTPPGVPTAPPLLHSSGRAHRSRRCVCRLPSFCHTTSASPALRSDFTLVMSFALLDFPHPVPNHTKQWSRRTRHSQSLILPEKDRETNENPRCVSGGSSPSWPKVRAYVPRKIHLLACTYKTHMQWQELPDHVSPIIFSASEGPCQDRCHLRYLPRRSPQSHRCRKTSLYTPICLHGSRRHQCREIATA